MEVREGIPTDKKDIEALWKYCFNDGESFHQYYFSNVFPANTSIVAKDSLSQNLIGALQLNPYELHYYETNWKVSYVVGVSVAPWSRGIGVMKPLMKKALQKCYQNKEAITILMPIDDRLYSGYGFRYTHKLMEYVLDTNILPKKRFNQQIKPLVSEDVPQLVELYSEVMKEFEGYSVRKEKEMNKFFEEVQSEDGYLYGVYQAGVMVGYFAYYMQNEMIYVRELFYKDIEALRAALTFFYHHNTQKPKIKIQAPQASVLPRIMENMRAVEVYEKSFMMARIINVEMFFSQSKWSKHAKGEIRLCINDEEIPDNNSSFVLTFEKGQCTVKKENKSHSDIQIDIGTLTQFFIGDMSLEEGKMLNRIMNTSEEDEVLLQQLKSTKIKYINEYI